MGLFDGLRRDRKAASTIGKKDKHHEDKIPEPVEDPIEEASVFAIEEIVSESVLTVTVAFVFQEAVSVTLLVTLYSSATAFANCY